jgi:hypothetical protein
VERWRGLWRGLRKHHLDTRTARKYLGRDLRGGGIGGPAARHRQNRIAPANIEFKAVFIFCPLFCFNVFLPNLHDEERVP